MAKIDPKRYGPNTNAVRAGQVRSAEGEHSEPIVATSSFVFKDAAQAAARFSGDEPGNIYSRFTNPTVRTFEERLAALEGAERCVATSSGMSSILSTFLGLLKAGDHIIASRSIFGTTVGLLDNVLSKFGLTTTFVDLADYEAWESAIRPETKMLFLETPSNPLTEIADISRLAEIAHSNGCLLVVDNCFCTPVLQKPFSLGADIVIHSATKYIDGQGRCIGGAVLGSDELLAEDVVGFLRTAGPTMSPFNAWVFLKGLETLHLRMKVHCENALQVAEWLEQQDKVKRVYYPGLVSHPQHELAKTQQSGFGGVLSFEVEGGQKAAWNIVDSTSLFSITANLGDTKSTITHPASTTHHRLTDEQRVEAGINDGLLRLSIGFEDVSDLTQDLAAGLGLNH
ncbi:MAG: O-succinylhomoserine sulfhydrylase [Gammaproteobacteria bacterium]|nr:O-succinylhomoserine sulfhydrylase [Gammaproteobacteria bacterium]